MSKDYRKRITSNMIIQIILFSALTAADQIIKYIAVLTLKDKEPVVIIKDVLELRYLENSGAAFGILQDKQVFFYILTAVVIAAIIVIWLRSNKNLKKYSSLVINEPDKFRAKTFKGITFINYILSILCAGAVGNLIDRVINQYVVDYIYFKIIDFPLFNLADICVTLSACALIVFFIFIYKDDPEMPLFVSKNKKNEAK